MWNDPAYGFSDPENVGFWAQAALDCFENSQKIFIFSNGANKLKNYFAITDTQIKVLMDRIYAYVKTLQKLLL
jgi:hypothetical protein